MSNVTVEYEKQEAPIKQIIAHGAMDDNSFPTSGEINIARSNANHENFFFSIDRQQGLHLSRQTAIDFLEKALAFAKTRPTK